MEIDLAAQENKKLTSEKTELAIKVAAHPAELSSAQTSAVLTTIGVIITINLVVGLLVAASTQ